MRHLKAGSKLKRDGGSRKALLRNLVTSVIEHERVVTTVPKAKAVKPLIDKMITLGKRDTLHARRQAASFLETPKSVKKLFDSELVKRAAERAKRREERLKAQREGREEEQGEE
jgi:large subunit ribosomal protein L17